MNLIDLYALTAIVVVGWGIKHAIDHYDPDVRERALHAGFYHFPLSKTCPEGYPPAATTGEGS